MNNNPATFGLIGRNISYSFSKKYFSDKFKNLLLPNYRYDLFDLNSLEEFESVLNSPNLKGLNVTIPYKVDIIPLLDEVSEEAQAIGAVNTVVFKEGNKIGYNTDAFGFKKTLEIHRKNKHHKALILGDGGAAKAVRYVLDSLGIPHHTVSRKGEITFDNLQEDLVSSSPLIIQTTPVGTFPNTNDCVPFPFQALSDDHLIIDLIYNPTITQFMENSAKRGAKCVNGYFMLESQAEKAWQLWQP